MVEWLPVGHVLARTPAGSGVIAPGTVARAALAPGVAEIGRVVAPGAGAATEARPLAAPLAFAEPGVVAESGVVAALGDVAELSFVAGLDVGAELGVVAVAPARAGSAHKAPAAGGDGISNPLSSAVRAGVRATFGSLPPPSGAACCSSMGPPDRPRADAGGDVGRRP